MIITDLYQTKIEVTQNGLDCFEIDINSTDITVTVTLLDFNNRPVTDKSITITCDSIGGFTHLKDKTHDTNLTHSYLHNVNGTTNSNGQVILTYTPIDRNDSEDIRDWDASWGIVTFNCNETDTQCLITGTLRKTINYDDELSYFRPGTTNNYTLYNNSLKIYLSRSWNITTVNVQTSFTQAITSGDTIILGTIPKIFGKPLMKITDSRRIGVHQSFKRVYENTSNHNISQSSGALAITNQEGMNYSRVEIFIFNPSTTGTVVNAVLSYIVE